MRDELLTYYERELTFIRKMAAEFSEKYPKIARRLVLEPDKCEDPHVERLIESFAFLAARIHLKIDDEFPEITESLLQVLYPHYLSPIPSMSIVQFLLDPEQGKLSGGYTVESHTTLYSKLSQQTTCRFRTCYPVTLWPIEVQSADMEIPGPLDSTGKTPGAVIRLKLVTQGDASFSELEIEQLRFFLSGESQLVHHLYEAILGHCYRVELRVPGSESSPAPVVLPANCVGEVGFKKEEGMLPYSSRSFLGYLLLQEYFSFPQKFLFFDLKELHHLSKAKFENAVEILMFFDQSPAIEGGVNLDNFRLGCSPIVNLFEQGAEPIRLDHAHTEYRVIPDVRRQNTTEVYSIDSVTSISPSTGESMDFQPFYSFKHSFQQKRHHTFWHATRHPSGRKGDLGTEVYLTLVDLNFRPRLPPTDTLTVRITTTNRDLPGILPFGDPEGDFELSTAAPLKQINCLIKPTKARRLPLGHAAQWRLISHLSLNYLSIVGYGTKNNSTEALQEILRLYVYDIDSEDSRAITQQITGLTGISSRQVMRRIRAGEGSGFARGIEVILNFEETHYVGSGVFLFASVLEKFLGLYVSINSFSELVAKTNQGGIIKRWPPRSGDQTLL